MLRTAFFGAATGLATLVFSLIAVVGGLVAAPPGLFDWVHRTWAGLLLRAAGVRLEATGLEHVPAAEARILVANHQSWFDIWGLMAATPASLRFVAKAELSRIPIFARACRAAGHVFIDRDDRDAALRAIRAAGSRMRREGLSLVLFPEGTRSPDGKIRRFKHGAFGLALETRVPIVPVAIQGGHKIMGKGRVRVRAGTLRLRYARPIPTVDLGAGDRHVLAARCQEQIAGMLRELDAP